MSTGWKRFQLVLLGSLIICSASSLYFWQARAAGGGDIFCNCSSQRYDLPYECYGNCKKVKQPCTGCFLSPQCPALRGNDVLKQLYNQAIFFKGMVPRPQSQQALVAHIINHYYKPYNASQVQITIGQCAGWAELENQPNAAGKYPLTVSEDLFCLSPAMLVSAIGHEMVHLGQYQHGSRINLAGLDHQVTALRELEASSWESGASNFKWPIGTNLYFACLLPAEQAAGLKTLGCRHWQVQQALAELNEWNQLGQISRFEKWLQENPWTNSVWLPQNPNWKKYQVVSQPAECR